jgi:uncharacterized Fe-S radical SAM superfamily protein PflX
MRTLGTVEPVRGRRLSTETSTILLLERFEIGEFQGTRRVDRKTAILQNIADHCSHCHARCRSSVAHFRIISKAGGVF